ncbi:hypothetical protein Poly59_39430 [Rubripirellula reticaptiva]|uniref:Uncharacterized protein n=2 Tax=Rubripirellula reticaptiva TaxID=2528013 RepID=A0A5C6EPP5_9BACT|nr:hypothetical protein Poly59_39430 [Rubripirellula reticaptiva]
MTGDEFRLFERGSWVYPHPVALSCGRIIRSRSEETLLDALLKGAEILARYLASVSLASYSVREDATEAPELFAKLDGHLAFGHFLSVTQQTAKLKCNHPAKPYLKSGFSSDDGSKDARPTDDALTKLLNLRNELGHDLNSINRARAISILKEQAPQTLLVAALTGVQGLLQLPLFVVEDIRFTKGNTIGQRLMLMGDGADPPPESIELSSPLHDDGDPYIGFSDSVYVLAPMLVWRVSHKTANYKLFIFDTILSDSVKYKAVEVSTYESQDNETNDFHSILAGNTRQAESLTLADGRSFAKEWSERRRALEAARENLQGRIQWDSLSTDTMNWYASKLATEGDTRSPQEIIHSRLLDDRDSLNAADTNQLQMLFGTDAAILKTLGRELIDLRAVMTVGERWDERVESHSNVIDCLKKSVEFFSKYIGVYGVTLDGLKATSGSADYLAMREALVNLFIHQDFADQRAAAQVEIQPEQVVCFNPGKSLTNTKALVEGGKSVCRNPLVARALRLIGFAELAGSGLRQLQHAWRTQKRRPPQMESNPSANTFTLTLDWRTVPDNYNEFWKDRLGVKLSPSEATILNLSVDGLSVEQAASATGLPLDSAQEAIDTLIRQQLVDEQKKRFVIKSHLRELLQGNGEEGGANV